MQRVKNRAYDGNYNKNVSILSPINQEIVEQNVKHIPSWIETYHLTGLTIIWTVFVIIGGILSRFSPLAVWICLLALVGHLITDSFDGALGRYRQTGLVKWGFYVDHFGDFLLSSALIISFRMIEPRLNEYLIQLLLVVVTGFFVHSLLTTVTLNKLTLTFFRFFSPLEGQVAYILLYLSVLVFGPGVLLTVLPGVAVITSGGLLYLVLVTTNKLWRSEMNRRRKKSGRIT